MEGRSVARPLRLQKRRKLPCGAAAAPWRAGRQEFVGGVLDGLRTALADARQEGARHPSRENIRKRISVDGGSGSITLGYSMRSDFSKVLTGR
jgi:hypothetical protein